MYLVKKTKTVDRQLVIKITVPYHKNMHNTFADVYNHLSNCSCIGVQIFADKYEAYYTNVGAIEYCAQTYEEAELYTLPKGTQILATYDCL